MIRGIAIKKKKKKSFCVRCERLTYPIQEAADPKDHFPLEHQTAEGETEIETKQIQLGHSFAVLLSVFVLLKTSSI